MTKRVPTGVSFLRAVLALTIVSLAPAAASAAPIRFDQTIVADGASQTFNGSFITDNEAAVIRFVLGEGVYNLSAFTTSYAALPVGGFDPVLTLYVAPTLDASLDQYLRYTYDPDGPDPDGTLNEVAATFDDIDFDANLYDSSLFLTLTGNRAYVLALTQTGNLTHEDFTFDWDEDAPCGVDAACEPLPDRDLSFSVSTQLTPIDTTPVPEPGTLALLALGSLATAFVRRRRRGVVPTTRS